MQRNELGDVVILDADNNTIETPFDDLENLPADVVSKYLISTTTKLITLSTVIYKSNLGQWQYVLLTHYKYHTFKSITLFF